MEDGDDVIDSVMQKASDWRLQAIQVSEVEQGLRTHHVDVALYRTTEYQKSPYTYDNSSLFMVASYFNLLPMASFPVSKTSALLWSFLELAAVPN